jgi:T-complex protein 1 subunit delta
MLFLSQSLGCKPAASVDHFTPDVLASAELVEEVSTGAAKVVKVGILIVHWWFAW